MAYELIETVEVGSEGAASIEFTSIPQDGTDLVCLFSTASTNGASSARPLLFQLNGDSSFSYSYVFLEGDSASVTSGSDSDSESSAGRHSTSSDNAFGSARLYISNYTNNTTKSILIDSVTESDGNVGYQTLLSSAFDTNSGISSIKIYPNLYDFAQYSTASLYKIS